MLTIYGVYRSRASRNIWLAGELGIPFRHVPVMQRYRLSETEAAGVLHTRSPEFLAVNPNGHIPSIDDDGLVLHESLAINLYLAKKYGGPLAPADLREDALMAMWSMWAATEVEPFALQIILNMVDRANDGGCNDETTAAIESLRAPFAVLESELAATGYVVGGRFTVADLNLAEVFRYAQPAKELFQASPHIHRWLETCQSRPAFREMMAAREAEPA